MATFTDNTQPDTLPQWLQQQARQQGTGIALRHKRLGVWQMRTWRQLAAEVEHLAMALQVRGFVPGASLVIVSRPRPEALIAVLAAQWLGGVAALLDPLEAAAAQVPLLRELHSEWVFAEGHEEIQRLRAAGLAPRLLIYADGRGMAEVSQAGDTLAFAQLLLGSDHRLEPQARAERTAFTFYRLGAGQRIEQQRISHAELLKEGRRLVHSEQLGRQEEALAARAFAAGSQARYLLAPWLIAGFRLNFPENLATRDQDRRELGPTLVAGTRETYERLHAQVLARLPEPGSWRRRLVDWALVAHPGALQRHLGYWLIRRPLRDILGFSRTRAPLVVGEALAPHTQAFFQALAIEVRTWPDPAQWHRPARWPAPLVNGWIEDSTQPA
ncbi:MAG: AMP-binding protein [Pseudomonas sp.]|uniref:AMP-binding protein n=1 Tax=Pseudomonas sp. TaxID=306 RepID=UPI003D141435